MRLSALLFLLLLAACSNPPAPAVKKTAPASAADLAFEEALQRYYALSEHLVRWDSAAAASSADDLVRQLDSMNVKKGESMQSARAELVKLKESKTITDQRLAFNNASDHLAGAIREAGYSAGNLYLQQCPMAFNDTGTGIWISAGDSIRNPYLGLYHPRYRAGMLHCGENLRVLKPASE